MSVHVLLSLVNELKKRYKMQGLPSLIIKKYWSMNVRSYLSHEIENHIFVVKTSKLCHFFTHRYNGRYYATLLNL